MHCIIIILCLQTFVSELEADGEDNYSLQEISDCLPFIEKCVELCWFFVLQTPAIILDTDFDSSKGKPFDKDRYHPYTTAGEEVDIVVWPALYYENDGSVVAKGVAKTK